MRRPRREASLPGRRQPFAHRDPRQCGIDRDHRVAMVAIGMQAGLGDESVAQALKYDDLALLADTLERDLAVLHEAKGGRPPVRLEHAGSAFVARDPARRVQRLEQEPPRFRRQDVNPEGHVVLEMPVE